MPGIRLPVLAVLVLLLATAAGAEQPLLSAARDVAAARRLIGQPVYTADGVHRGRVVSLVADASGRPVAAVVRHGGLLGWFESEALVPADQVATVNRDVVVLLWTAADLAAAPGPGGLENDPRRVVLP